MVVLNPSKILPKAKEQFINELVELRQRIAELETS